MANKFPGTCTCGARVPANMGQVSKINGKWQVTCRECASDWNVYVDRHLGETCYFVGRSRWQTCYSSTYHVGVECYTKAEVAETLAWARTLTAEQAEAEKRHTDTWGRFEMACDRGEFGAEWGNY